MPVAKSLRKVQKKVAASKTTLHPKGLKAQQLNRAAIRRDKLQRAKTVRDEIKGSSVRYFQEAVNLADQQTFSIDEIKDFIRVDQEEVDKLQAQRRPGRPASSKQDQLTMKIEKEQKEFKTGFLVPDLTDRMTVERVRQWRGDQGGLNVIKFVRVAEDQSSFVAGETEMTDA